MNKLVHNNQILLPANNAGCDVNPLRGFPRKISALYMTKGTSDGQG